MVEAKARQIGVATTDRLQSGQAPMTDSARGVLRALSSEGALTRPKLSALLSLSKPTMYAAIAELEALGLVDSDGMEKGPLGRTALTYKLGAGAGFVVGIDGGATRVRAIAQGLDGGELARRESENDPKASIAERSAALWAVAKAVIAVARKKGGPLRSMAVAVPRIVSAERVQARRPDGPEATLERLRRQVSCPLIVENNVNCAAIGEMSYGVARGRPTFAYLQIGVRIGLGIVSEGRLMRGASGGAGEVGRVPYPWSAEAAPVQEGLEHHLGADALIARCARDWPAADGPPPTSAKELFERAEAGSSPAMAHVLKHAGDIGRLVAACVGVVDPGLIVLGGGVGQNRLLQDEVARVATALTWPTEVAISALAGDATLLGATRLAFDYSVGLLLGENRQPAVVLPRL